MSITRVRQLIGEWCNELEDIHHNINTLLQSNGHTHTHKQPVIEYLPMMKYNSLNTLTTHTHMPHTHTTHTHTHNTHTERALQYFPTSRKFVDAHQCDMTNKESPPVNIKSVTTPSSCGGVNGSPSLSIHPSDGDLGTYNTIPLTDTTSRMHTTSVNLCRERLSKTSQRESHRPPLKASATPMTSDRCRSSLEKLYNHIYNDNREVVRDKGNTHKECDYCHTQTPYTHTHTAHTHTIL
eukprot:GHVR01052974.1.p1 GENE.GHVR01052974.1~~GHVR01052974.1.p1  ORF type:complete len:238 (+),score=99.16 GHVR01052974.1:65-778(+)